MLCTEVSPHARSAIREADLARRIMFAAKSNLSLPRQFSDDLMSLHGRDPFPDGDADIRAVAALVRDPNYRVQVAEDGIYVYNRDGVFVARGPFELFPHLKVEGDAGHAFYLGVELARAQIAWQLGKRYAQDGDLQWGAAMPREKPP